MFGIGLAITAGGGTHNLGSVPNAPNEYIVTGAVALAGNWVIQLDPAMTPYYGQQFILQWKAVISLAGNNVTIFGQQITQDLASKEFKAECTYDGAAWMVMFFPDQSGTPSGATGTETQTLTNGGGTINLIPGRNENYVILDGAPTLTSSWTIQSGGVPVDGDEFWIRYKATATVGVNTITIFGIQLSANQALFGQSLVYAKYNGAAWEVVLIDNMSESNSPKRKIVAVVAGDNTITLDTAMPTAIYQVLYNLYDGAGNQGLGQVSAKGVNDFHFGSPFIGTLEYLVIA